MKKAIIVILGLSMIVCLAACTHTSGAARIGNLKEYEIGGYTLNLPETYISKNLAEVKAESNCIAMMSDANGTLPDLWIYEDKCLGNDLKEHVFNSDAEWHFKELSLYQKDGKSLARTSYDEQWYGQSLINVHYYRIEQNGMVLSFDFAFDVNSDYEIMHAYVLTIAASLGF